MKPVPCCPAGQTCSASKTYVPWYAGRFGSIEQVADFWKTKADTLKLESAKFRDAFYKSTLPPEVIEAVAANLTILKSPTVLRQTDGRLWNFEGCGDDWGGCCHGSCTHVWNYAQAIAHLFPSLERTLRETEFLVSQDETGHQQFRSNLPIRPVLHNFYAAADGQLGGIMKVHREWRISGDTDWMAKLWPKVKQSLDYCIRTWDPRERGVLEEPHHNTYDIEFWGPNGFSTSFYLGALDAAIRMGKTLGEDVSALRGASGQRAEGAGVRTVQRRILHPESPMGRPEREESGGTRRGKMERGLFSRGARTAEKRGTEIPVRKRLPFGRHPRPCGWPACAESRIRSWIRQKVKSHLESVYRYNLKHDLRNHSNPQRPSFAMGSDGGLLLCTWPKGDALTLPFVYSNEVWTGIEYQAASHMMLEGFSGRGTGRRAHLPRPLRRRIRNPFDEYECGHWYGRALSSYGLLQGLTGVRYDAVDKDADHRFAARKAISRLPGDGNRIR